MNSKSAEQSKQASPHSLPLVSVVITTKNEAAHIKNCLLSVQEQSYPNLEVIVVDNYSDDETKVLAKQYTSFIFNRGPERSAQRNYGMLEIASGKYGIFLDADMILAPHVIRECVAVMMRSECVALHIPEVVLGKNYWSRVRRFERSFYDGTAIDGARFFTRDVFVRIGGFDTTMSGPEDWDLDKKFKQVGEIQLLPRQQRKSGYPVGHIWPLEQFIWQHGVEPCYDNVIYHNEAEFVVRRYLAKKRYYAQSFDVYILKWGKNDPDIRKQLGVWYRFAGVFVERGKWKALVKNIHLAVGMYVLRILVGLNFLMRAHRECSEKTGDENFDI